MIYLVIRITNESLMEKFNKPLTNKFLDLEHKTNGDVEAKTIFTRDKEDASYLIVNSMINYDNFSDLDEHRKMFIANVIKNNGVEVKKETPLHNYIIERDDLLKKRNLRSKMEEAENKLHSKPKPF
jgi:hypothetical protein